MLKPETETGTIMQIPKWTSRTFKFDHPVGHFPYFIERLRATVPRLEEQCGGLSEEILTRKPGGTWSIKENIGHLIDLEELHEGRLDDFRQGASILRAWDVTNARTTNANHNQRSLRELIAGFRTVRGRFIEGLAGLNTDELSRTAQHPRLNLPMRVVDMAYFVAEHDVHHLARISELASSSKEPV